MTVPEARDRVEPLMLAGGTHPDYARCAEHATLCRRLASGDVGPLLRRYHARESQADFDARVALTISTIPAVWSELSTPFYQVSRLKGSQVDRRFDYPADLSEAERARRVAILSDALSRYYEGRPVEDYLSEHVVQSEAMTDPNAWLLTTFDTFDFRTQRPRPYPVLMPCEAVVDFARTAGVVQSVTFRLQVTHPSGVTGERYVCYLDNEALDYWPVLTLADNQTAGTLPEGSTLAGEVGEPGGKRWQLRVLRHNAGAVPAVPIGYRPDPLTKGRTYVSPLNPALSFLEKEIATGSELDIVMAKVVHPHKSQFVPPCPGIQEDGGCIAGKAPTTQSTCRLCHGTAQSPIATSAMDVLTFPLPKNLEDVQKLDLSKMVHFSAPPVELPKFQVEYQDYLVARAQRTLFNTSTLSQVTVTRTATERLAENDQRNTALMPMAECLSRLYVHAALTAAGYTDVRNGLDVAYEFPRDLLPPSLQDLEAAYGEARNNGLDTMYLEQKYKDIIRRRFADNPEERRKMEVKMRFIPYIGASDDYVIKLATMGYISAEKRTLRLEQDSIFYELERDAPGFYDLSPAAQQQLVDEKVKDLIAALPQPTAVGSMTFPKATIPAPAGPAAAFAVGESVMVRPGKEHMSEHKGLLFTVAEVQGNTYALKQPDGSIHKWYTADELMGMSPATKPAKAPAMAM